MATETVTFDILARDRASRVFRNVGDAADRSASRIGRSGHKVGLSLSKGIGGGLRAGIGAATHGAIAGIAIGLTTGALALKKFYSEADEARKVTALTQNVIKTTGGAANVTARQVAALSEAISNKTGIDDEAVQSGANLLLTFKNVRNELGEGNKVFNEAVGLAQDLSASGFGSAESAAKMLGKALNDPIAGLTALGRAGVTFSEKQKRQIEGFVEANDLLSAQKIILAEVTSQVGGAAEATATPMQKLRTVLNNVAETIGTVLLPYIDRAATWLAERLPGAMATARAFARNRLIPALRAIGAFIQDEINPRLEALADVIRNVVAPAVGRLSTKISGDLGKTLHSVTNDIRDIIKAFRVFDGSMEESGSQALTLSKILGGVLRGVLFNVRTNVKLLTNAFQVATVNVRIFANVAYDAVSFVRGAVNGLIAAVNSLKSALSSLRPPSFSIPGSGGGGFDLNPFRAAGGPVTAGRAYVVGERRPELFVPRTSGTIVPSLAGAGGGGMQVHFHGGTFVGGSQAQWEDVFVQAYDSARRKRRIP